MTQSEFAVEMDSRNYIEAFLWIRSKYPELTYFAIGRIVDMHKGK